MRDLHALPPFLNHLTSPVVVGQGRSFFTPAEPLTPLFGREDDLRGVVALLSGESVRLVTLTGAPGVGKTRLALALCSEWRQVTGEDICFVPLSAVSDAAFVLPTIAYGLNVQPENGEPLVERVAKTLGGRSTLLVLDNFEQVVTAASDVIDLLIRCPRLSIVVTSRAALRVRGEYEWHLLPLKLPGVIVADELPTLALNPAVALLLDRARAHQAGLALTEANAAAITGMCVRLEGIPLAIELAAAWLKLFSPEILLERLAQDLALLRDGARDLPERQRTLSGAIAWSDNLLESGERLLFHSLAVFSDGWSLAAAQAVCAAGDSSDAEHALLSGLSSLLDKSLIQRRTAADGSPRFRMLELIRTFALRQLEASEAAGAVHDRHAAVYLAFVQEAAPHLYLAQQAEWMERLEADLGNLRSALRWLIDGRHKTEALRFAVELENFWLVHDHLGEGQRWLEEALSLDESTAPLVESEARRALATLMQRRGEYTRARALYTLNLTFARAHDDDVLGRQSLLDLGSLSFISGDLDQARSHFRQVLALGREVVDWRTVARALNQLGEIARFSGDDALAAQRYRESLSIWRKLTETERIAMVLHNLAPVVARGGEKQQAAEFFAESLAISWGLRNTHGAAICLSGIAGMAQDTRSQSMVAAKILGAADALRESIGVQWQPVDRIEFERSVATVRSCIDDATFEISWSEGRGLSLAAAVELATKLLDGSHSSVETTAVKRYRPTRDRGGLSRREYEVVTQIALGLTNREIASALSVSEKTIEMHVSHSLSKLRVRSRAQLAAWVTSQQTAGETPTGSLSR